MAKRKRGFTEEKYKRWVKEGRGSGELSEYKPWIRIQDVSSLGTSTRPFSHKTGRQHELLSNHEKYYLYILEFSDRVVDIREQYPLLMREDTISIAEELGIQHPKDPSTKENIVMTTDFIIIEEANGKMIMKARTIKQVADLKERVLEKFEIERAYWERRGIDWKIVTENEINDIYAENLKMLRKFCHIKNQLGVETLSKRNREIILTRLQSTLVENKNRIIRDVLTDFDDYMSLQSGTSIALYKHLIYNKRLQIDLTGPFDLDGYCQVEYGKNHIEELRLSNGVS